MTIVLFVLIIILALNIFTDVVTRWTEMFMYGSDLAARTGYRAAEDERARENEIRGRKGWGNGNRNR